MQTSLTGHPLRAEFAYSNATSITVRDAETGKIRWRTWGHTLAEERAAWLPSLYVSYDPTGKWLASGGSDGTVRLWHAEDGKAGPVLSMDNACCTGVSWTATGTLVAVYLDGSVELFQKGKRVSRWRSLSLKGSPSWCVSPTGDRLVSLSSGHPGYLRSWDLRTGRLLSPTYRHTGNWYRLQWLDNRRLVSGDTAGVLIEWDCFAGKGRRRWELGSVKQTLRADGREAAVDLRAVQRIALLDMNRNERIGTLAYPEGTRLEAIEYAPDGKQIALIYRHATKWAVPTLRLLDTAGRQVGRDVEVGDRFASKVWPTFSQDGSEIGVRYRSGSVEPRWKWVRFARNGPKQTTIVDLGTEREWFAIHPQLRYAMGVALPGFGTTDLIDLASGQIAHRWDENHWVTAASFSACGRWLALAESNEIRIWELRTKRIVRRWPVTDGVTMLAFSPNGRWIAAAKDDSRIEVWDGWPSQGATRKTPPTEAELRKCWDRLASEDATAAHDAIAALLSTPEVSAAFLARRMGPSLPMQPKRFTQLLADLDDDDFATRQRAEQTLRAAGSALTTQVQQALKQPGQSLEHRRRLQRLQAAWPTDPAMVQRDRALFALEQMGEPGRALLYRIAEGAPEAEITQLARAALNRRR